VINFIQFIEYPEEIFGKHKPDVEIGPEVTHVLLSVTNLLLVVTQ